MRKSHSLLEKRGALLPTTHPEPRRGRPAAPEPSFYSRCVTTGKWMGISALVLTGGKAGAKAAYAGICNLK